MHLERIASFLERVTHPLTRWMSVVGAGVLAAMMVLAAMDVLLRYLFNRPINGALELIQYMMLIVVVSGLAYCTVDKSHIRVEALIDRCPAGMRAVLYCVTSFLGLGLVVMITRQSVIYAGLLRDSNLTSPVLFIPAFPFAIIQAVAMAVFCLALLAEFVQFLSKAVRK